MYANAGAQLVRRGMEAARSSFDNINPQHIAKLQHDAELYENSDNPIQPQEMLPVALTGLVFLLLIASIRYTLGEVVASLAMVESPSSTAIIESKPPAYTDEPDLPIEKEPLVSAEAVKDTDVEITVINHKPITGTIRGTIKHLHQNAGFFSRWRGLTVSIVYHFLHSTLTNVVGAMLGFGLMGNALAYIVSSVIFCRMHMIWTHVMISKPSTKSWFRRAVPRKEARHVLLPSLVFAAAQQATLLLPLFVAAAVGLPTIDGQTVHNDHGHICHKKAIFFALRLMSIPATALLVALAVLLPAAVTLTRVEAALLSAEDETIVPFDRQALIGDVDLTKCGSARALFVQAWRSFDRPARLRLIKLYVKIALIITVVALAGMQLMAAEVYLIGGDRLAVLAKSGAAQMQLAAIEAHSAGH